MSNDNRKRDRNNGQKPGKTQRRSKLNLDPGQGVPQDDIIFFLAHQATLLTNVIGFWAFRVEQENPQVQMPELVAKMISDTIFDGLRSGVFYDDYEDVSGLSEKELLAYDVKITDLIAWSVVVAVGRQFGVDANAVATKFSETLKDEAMGKVNKDGLLWDMN